MKPLNCKMKRFRELTGKTRSLLLQLRPFATSFLLCLSFLTSLPARPQSRDELWKLGQTESPPPSPAASAQLEQFSQSLPWLRALHYLPYRGGYRSELDGSGFFFAPNGKFSPLAELVASIKAFDQDLKLTDLKLHPQCAFPERFRLLRDTFHLKIQEVECPLFKKFLDRFQDPIGLTLVFSSAYPNNPASMFGHTFLKIRSERTNALLDTGVNFAAWTPPDSNLFAFMYLGVFGGYRGIWSTEPYYKKVNEYINSESRDLWEYDLNLTTVETNRLIGHLWELEINSHFKYYFFDKNCSYQILRAIEAVRTEWDITQHRIYVIPGETIKQVSAIPGIVREVRFRPSLFHQVELRYDLLSQSEKWDYQKLARSRNENDIDRQYSTEVLETGLLSMLYLKAKKKKNWSEEDQEIENRLLLLRSQNPQKTPEAELPRGLLRSQPDLGHDSYSVHSSLEILDSMSVTTDEPHSFGRIKIRSAYHDLMGSDLGFSPFSEIEFPWIELQLNQESIKIQELGLISSTSLFPLNQFNRSPSWRLRWAFETEKGLECQDCLVGSFEGGYGLSLGGVTHRLYSLGLSRAEAHSRLPRGFRLRPGIESGWIWNPFAPYKVRLLGRILWNSKDWNLNARNYEFRVEHSFSIARNQELRQATILNYDHAFNRRAWFEIRFEWLSYFR